MNEINATTGFNFYEMLRYILPGVLFVFLFGYIILPEYGAKIAFSEKMIIGVLIGFIIHSFDLYKYIPGSPSIRNKYHKEAAKILFNLDDLYFRWDIMLLSINDDERHHFKRYYALGAFKLDMVFIVLLFLFTYILFVILSSFFIIYVLREDGLNDLDRGFRIAIFSLLESKDNGQLEKRIHIVNNNKVIFKNLQRNPYHPRDICIDNTIKNKYKKNIKDSIEK